MFTMKAALIAASTAGTLTVGGVTWAATGQSGLGLPGGDTPKKPVAVEKVKDALPAAPPTCLPKSKLPTVPGAPAPKTRKLPQAPDASKPNVPNVPLPEKAPKPPKDVPGVPSAPGAPALPNPKDLPKQVPNAPGAPALPNPKDLPKQVPGVPGAPKELPKLPECGPDARLPKTPPTTLPTTAPKPGTPKLPAAPAFRCDDLPPAVPVGGTVEKTLVLPKGLSFTTAHTAYREVNGRKFCAITQKWAGKAGQWLTVERLKVPSGVTEKDLRQALKLPTTGGRQITLNGHVAWQAPTGGGVLVYDQDGYSLFLNGSPVMSGGLKDIAGALQQVK